jgi:hypothetical protein
MLIPTRHGEVNGFIDSLVKDEIIAYVTKLNLLRSSVTTPKTFQQSLHQYIADLLQFLSDKADQLDRHDHAIGLLALAESIPAAELQTLKLW